MVAYILTMVEDREPEVKDDACQRCTCTNLKTSLVNNLLLVLTIAGVLIGFCLGFGIREARPSEDALMWLGLPGQLYLRLLKMLIVPLVVCSVICGAASLDPKSNGKISMIALVFAVSTNALGSALGVGSALIFSPGTTAAITASSGSLASSLKTQDVVADFLRNIIPDNLFVATMAQTQTQYKIDEGSLMENTTGANVNATVKVTRILGQTDSPNIIGLIISSSLVGAAALKLGESGRPFLKVVQSASDIVLMIVRWYMWTTPVGVVSLVAVSLASIADIQNVFAQLGLFILTVTVGIVVQQLVLMPLIFFVSTRKNPYAFLLSIARPWMIAFAATSTAVIIPEMLTCCEEGNKIDKRVSRFVVPFSVTISCNGGACYVAAASMFVANLTGNVLNAGDIIFMWLLVTVAAMAIPSVPSASIMTVIMILTSMNIPVEDIALLLAVEWYLDRIRITSSVVSHTFCAAVVFSLCQRDLAKLDENFMFDQETIITVERSQVENSLTMLDDTDEKPTNDEDFQFTTAAVEHSKL